MPGDPLHLLTQPFLSQYANVSDLLQVYWIKQDFRWRFFLNFLKSGSTNFFSIRIGTRIRILKKLTDPIFCIIQIFKKKTDPDPLQSGYQIYSFSCRDTLFNIHLSLLFCGGLAPALGAKHQIFYFPLPVSRMFMNPSARFDVGSRARVAGGSQIPRSASSSKLHTASNSQWCSR